MIITGIVVEYNPFHNGHLYHIKQARKLTNCDLLVAIMSPTFMQRGEPAIIDKYTRAQVAIKHGVDLLLELPSIYAINSANHFAAGALKLLNEVGINYLVFGSESNDVKTLEKAAKISLQPDYQAKVKEYIDQGIRYANACNYAFNDFKVASVADSNDILGLAYVQEIYKHQYQIKPLSIQRTNEYLNQELTGKISSATAIRQELHQQNAIDQYSVMAKELSNPDLIVHYNDYFQLLQYTLNTKNAQEINQIYGFEEGLEYLFLKHINQASDINDFIERVSSKRYPKTRIQRLITYLLLNHTKLEHQAIEVDYLRILAMNKKAQAYIKELKKQTNYQIISNFSASKSNSLQYEKKVSYVYSLAKPSLNYLNQKEYQSRTIIIDHDG